VSASKDNLNAISRRGLLASASAAVGVAGVAHGAETQAVATPCADELERLFFNPPPEAKPGVVWHWYNGLVSREGITADIDAMADAGIGRALLFSVGIGIPAAPGVTPVRSLSEEWWALIEHAFERAAARGIEIGFTICDGWATAGGPWITPELSMQRLTHSEMFVVGGQTPSRPLTRPPAIENYYRDLRVVAFPLPPAWETSLSRTVEVTSSYAAERLNELNGSGAAAIIDTDQPGWIQYSFEQPFTVRGLSIEGPPGIGPGAGLELHSSDDGVSFERIGSLAQPRLAPVSLRDEEAQPEWPRIDNAFIIEGAPATTARHFRLVFTPASAPQPPAAIPFDGLKGDPEVPPSAARLTVSRIIFTDQRLVPHINERNGQAWALPEDALSDADLPAQACVDPNGIIDLTARMDEHGVLNWSPPRGGVWKILRIGHTSTGRVNETAQPDGRGLECDKLRRDVVRLQFSHWFGEVVRRLNRGPGGRALKYLNVDSWESGSQNWSPALPHEFHARRGYRIESYLPLLVGTPIENADVSDRVLRDFRRTIAETVQDTFFAELGALTRDTGYGFIAQPADPIFPVDPLARAAHVDMPMGEFWVRGDDKPFDIAGAIHGGHVYGRRIITAEAFTQFGMQWNETPWTLKAMGDANWAKGVNHLHCHLFPSQPWVDEREPGITLSSIGSFICRTNTWWPLAKPWFAYMHRSQALLQQGLPVVDLCYFIGEDIPARAYVPSTLPVPAPDGYSFDSINADVLLRLARVEDGDIVLPHGQRYRVLVLPSGDAMSPRLLNRLADLARAGATIIGPPPSRSISREGGAAADRRVARLARAMWGPLASGGRGVRAYGRGRVGSLDDLSGLLREHAGGPDFVADWPGLGPDQASPLMWAHRAGPDWDVYFLSSQSLEPVTITARFRVTGRAPEIWRADTGAIESLAAWTQADGCVSTDIALDPCGSVFVVFRRSAHAPPARVEARGLPLPEPLALRGPWRVVFNEGTANEKRLSMRALRSWTEQHDPDIRGYAGLARYELTFEAPASHMVEGLRWRLDLGDVAELCEVSLNGSPPHALWKPPFTLDVDDYVRAGQNNLQVVVANTWRNRLAIDGPKEAGERQSYTLWPFYQQGPQPPAATPSRDYDENGLFFGGGSGNDARTIPRRGSPAGTPPPTRRGLSRYGFPGGGATAPGPAPVRAAGADGLTPAGLLGPVRLIAEWRA
jgi:hypothetical protein